MVLRQRQPAVGLGGLKLRVWGLYLCVNSLGRVLSVPRVSGASEGG